MSCDGCGGYEPLYIKNCPGTPVEVTGELEIDNTGAAELARLCRCDDVNGDGSLIINYVEAYLITASDDDPLQSVSQGTFTDDSLTTPYTPTNPVDCCEIGESGEPTPFVLCDDQGSFIRYMDVIGGIVIRDMAMDGSAYVPSGNVRDCSARSNRKISSAIYC